MESMQRTSAGRRPRQAVSAAAALRRLVDEVCNGGDLAVLDELLPPIIHADGVAQSGRLREYLAAFRAVVPDAHWTIQEQIAEHDAVALRLQVQGTFSGPLVGLAPPGRPATVHGVAIGRFAEGRLVDLWLQADLLGLLQQLGVMPPLDLARAVAIAQVRWAGDLLATDAASAATA
jgi:predicted ester cyclase